MAGAWYGGISPVDETIAWMKRRTADVARRGHDAEAAGREAWNYATRTGQKLAATKPSDVVALGARVIAHAPDQARHAAKIAGNQIAAAGRGAIDGATMGGADIAHAAAGAAVDGMRGGDLRASYHHRMERERAQDRYDAEHYKIARTVGQVLGTGAQIAALGPGEMLAARGVRSIAQAAPLIAREYAGIVGGGAAAGAGGQVLGDTIAGRATTPQDLAGAAIGGGVGAGLSPLGFGGYAGTAGGAATSVAQDVLNRRPISLEDAHRAAFSSGVLGALGGAAGRHWSNGLRSARNLGSKGDPNGLTKERLGESLSRVRTALRGGITRNVPQSRAPLANGKYTYPDQRASFPRSPSAPNGEGLIESKFGYWTSLSDRQIEAAAQLPNFRVDQWIPRDVGALAGFPAGVFGSQLSTHNDERLPGW